MHRMSQEEEGIWKESIISHLNNLAILLLPRMTSNICVKNFFFFSKDYLFNSEHAKCVEYLEDSTNHMESIKHICLVNYSHRVWDENIKF